MYFTIHVLGTHDDIERASGNAAWAPLLWAEAARELDRSERIASVEGLYDASRELSAMYEELADEIVDREDAGHAVDLGLGGGVSGAILGAVRRLRSELDLAGVLLDDAFALTAQDFDGMGGRDVLLATAKPALVEVLRRRDELPAD